MGLYFRKRVKILPGVHLNISKTGTSWSVGPRGASVNVGKRGTYVNAGIPGTGIYSRTKISGSNYNGKTSSYSSNYEKGNGIINKNPLRFALVYLFLLASIMIPLFTSASWIWFPILAFIGICCAFIPDNKTKTNDYNQNKNDNDNIHVKDYSTEIISTAKDDDNFTEESFIPNGSDNYIENNSLKTVDMSYLDPLFEEAARLIVNTQQGSTSLIQRKFTIGYNRAGRIMEQLEQAGIIGAANGSRPREVFCKNDTELTEKLQNLNDEMFQEITEDTYTDSYSDDYEKTSRLINIGIDLEKEGMIDEAIKVYEKSIIPQLPLKHPFERLAILYRKKKDYENEIRIMKIAVEVFMKENERRANRTIDEDNSIYNQVMQALETNESIKYEDGKWAFVQYDVMSYITRLEKAKYLLDKSNKDKV